MSALTVAVVGGTGALGTAVVKTLLSNQYHPEKVGRVLLFTRDSSSAKAKELIGLGAEASGIRGDAGAPAVDDLRGVDVLISCTGFGTSPETKMATAKAAIDAGVKVYFPSDYGFDPRLSKVRYRYLDARPEAVLEIRKLAEGKTKVIVVSTGIFLEWWLTPFQGVDLKTNVFETEGDPTVRRSGTSTRDIGHTVVQLAVLAAADPNSVPDDIRICGDTKSHQELADIVSNVTGNPIKVVGGDWEANKRDLDAKPLGMETMFGYARLIYAEGAVDYSKDNHNELVNPGESLFKWKTPAEYAKEIAGKS